MDERGARGFSTWKLIQLLTQIPPPCLLITEGGWEHRLFGRYIGWLVGGQSVCVVDLDIVVAVGLIVCIDGILIFYGESSRPPIVNLDGGGMA